LNAQPARALRLLVRRAGRLVPRRDLIDALWPDTIVEYDQSLNSVVRAVRRALGDDAREPRFVETVPRLGYRFLPPVVAVAEHESSWNAPPPARAGRRLLRAGVAAAALLAVATLAALRLSAPPDPGPPSPALAARALPGADSVPPRAVVETYQRARRLLVGSGAGPGAGSRAEASRLLEEVVAEAPGFVPARVALGELLVASGSPDDLGRAKSLSIETLRLAPENPRVHLLRAWTALALDWDWPVAGRHLERAAELGPGDPHVHAVRALYLASAGRVAEALDAADRAAHLDPLSARTQGDVVFVHFLAGDPATLLREADQLLSLDPEHPVGRGYRLEALLALRRWDEARELAAAMLGPGALASSVTGPEVEAAFLRASRRTWVERPPSALRAVMLASVAARSGDVPAALEHLDEAVRRHSPYAPFLAADPHFEPLHGHPAFERLLAAVGHPAASRSAMPVAGGP
jgi:tetratricopeptide (TPR) repeat protein